MSLREFENKRICIFETRFLRNVCIFEKIVTNKIFLIFENNSLREENANPPVDVMPASAFGCRVLDRLRGRGDQSTTSLIRNARPLSGKISLRRFSRKELPIQAHARRVKGGLVARSDFPKWREGVLVELCGSWRRH